MASWIEETVKVAGTDLVVIKGGSGRPLLMLHDELGYPGWVSWNDALAEDHEFIIPLQPGFGKTPRLDWIRSYRDLGGFYARVLREMKLSPIVKILFLHHHLRGGGVTRVLASQLRALQGHATCQLWTAQERPPSDFADLSFSYQPVSELDYLSPDTTPPQFEGLVNTLYTRLRQAAEQGWLLHVHNSSLGKNPAVTWTLYQLAKAGFPILLQYHDFAEDARPDNYARLKQWLEGRDRVPLAACLYPGFGRVCHVAVNRRDQGFLAGLSHLDTSRIDLLPNAIEEAQDELERQVDPATFRNRLNMRLQGPLWTYPVRGIRRKNLGEFALLAALFPKQNYLLTLAPQNPVEAEIYDHWSNAVQRLALPIHLNAGAVWPFEEIIAQSDGMLTTSIREGFGLTFLEPWMFAKGVTGRDLPDITQDFKNQGIVLEHFYPRLDIPLNAAQQHQLREAYRDYALANFEAMGVSMDSDRLNHMIECKVGAWTDFAALDRETQMDWVGRVAADQHLATRIRQRNALDRIWSIPPDRVSHNRQQIRLNYGLKAYGAMLLTLYQRLHNSQASPCPTPPQMKNPMLLNFLGPDHLHLLRK